jgi:hypothetical protein
MNGASASAKRCFAFGVFLARELEEGRGRHQAAIAVVEAASF